MPFLAACALWLLGRSCDDDAPEGYHNAPKQPVFQGGRNSSGRTTNLTGHECHNRRTDRRCQPDRLCPWHNGGATVVLNELQHIADSPDSLRRNRGRRGLEILEPTQKEESRASVRITDLDVPEAREVDDKTGDAGQTDELVQSLPRLQPEASGASAGVCRC